MHVRLVCARPVENPPAGGGAAAGKVAAATGGQAADGQPRTPVQG